MATVASCHPDELCTDTQKTIAVVSGRTILRSWELFGDLLALHNIRYGST